MSQVHLDKYINMTKYFFLRPKRWVNGEVEAKVENGVDLNLQKAFQLRV